MHGYAMHDYYHNIPPPLFQPSLYATDTSGFSGDPNNSSSHHSCGIPTVTSFPNFRMNLGTGTLLPSVTNAPSPYQAQQHPCETCPRVFGRKKDLKRHMVTVHATGQELVYRCRCGKSDIRKDNHRRHIRTCNKKNEGLGFFCKCLEKYEDEEMYLSHVALCPNPSSARE
ncbi:hypothetical protein GGR58DRAFT_518470 [Xylaria digitata]|nr:hypothetical protein GGR58DRAFT_518470 [Xylaria digitata]